MCSLWKGNKFLWWNLAHKITKVIPSTFQIVSYDIHNAKKAIVSSYRQTIWTSTTRSTWTMDSAFKIGKIWRDISSWWSCSKCSLFLQSIFTWPIFRNIARIQAEQAQEYTIKFQYSWYSEINLERVENLARPGNKKGTASLILFYNDRGRELRSWRTCWSKKGGW